MLVNFKVTGENGTDAVVCYDPATRSIFQAVPAIILHGDHNHHPSVDYQLSGDANRVEVVVGNVEESLRHFYEHDFEDTKIRIKFQNVDVDPDGTTHIQFRDEFVGEYYNFTFKEVSPAQNIYEQQVLLKSKCSRDTYMNEVIIQVDLNAVRQQAAELHESFDFEARPEAEISDSLNTTVLLFHEETYAEDGLSEENFEEMQTEGICTARGHDLEPIAERLIKLRGERILVSRGYVQIVFRNDYSNHSYISTAVKL